MKQAILIYSGGLDSSVLLAQLLREKWQVRALSVDYGQRHRREIQSARAACAKLGVEHRVADFSSMKPMLAGSSQTDDSVAVPHGAYDAPTMRKTIVPNRNALMLSAAFAWAFSSKADAVAYAAHAGDHQVYPDCREEFTTPFEQAMQNADWHKASLLRPFLKLSKGDIVALGHRLGADDLMAASYSCYEGEAEHCGCCGTCQERRSAFIAAKVHDQTKYSDAGLAEKPDSELPKV